MSARTLPPNPSLEQLKKQAKALLKAHRAGETEVVSRLRASVPQLASASDADIRHENFALHDAQTVIAREYGFEHWQALEAHIGGGASPQREHPPILQQILKAVDEVDDTTVASLLKVQPYLVTATVYDQDPHGETLLHRAIPGSGVETTPGHLKIAALLIDHGADPNAIGWGNNNAASPPLMIAAWGGNAEMAELLLTKGADPNIRDQAGSAELPIDTAAGHGHRELVEILIDHGSEFLLKHLISVGLNDRVIALLEADPQLGSQADSDTLGGAYSHNTGMPLHVAISCGNVEIVNALLDRGVDVNETDARGRTALHHGLNKPDIVSRLLERGAELDIWAAAGMGAADRVAALLAENPDLADAPQKDGITPIFWAARKGDPATVQLLLDHGVELNRIVHRWWYEWIPLFAALQGNHEEAARLMLEAGADPNFRIQQDDWQGATALKVAARWAPLSTVELLLDYGADINAGQSHLGWAVRSGNIELVQLFIDRGVDLHHPSHHYAPHISAEHGRNEVLELLVQHGANLRRKNSVGQTPLAVALFHGQSETAELLRRLGGFE
ncbi:MAG: hypothetical protein GKR89_36375 [Candidatus Latescibacteria bacterium]|nr:hypothetical protein [Candidatus Latescibacterota bacterium]